MDNILRLTGLTERRYTSNTPMSKIEQEIDFSNANRILDEKRSEARKIFTEYLNN